MQHVVHNRATIRVADRTDLSDRVTVDEVNLDRFHNRIRKVCALGRTWLALVAASVGLYLVLPDRGLAQSITLGTLKGTYISAQPVGYITINGNLTLISEADVATFFGNGTLSGMATVALAIPGAPENFRVTYTGTYKVNPDGVSMSAIVTITNPPPAIIDHFDLYPTLDGSSFAIIPTDPGVFQSAIYTRSSGERDGEKIR
ncbi:MAG: hypothetical protein JO232_00995 [Verrucomicrobia bacterium]|nr:hypothetical protein [Verrucomicrobiota bacterium]